MKKKLIVGAVAFTVLATAAILTIYINSNKLTKVPELSLHIIDGNKLNLNDLKGKPALVTFWATTCSTCVKEIPDLTKLYNELGRDNFEIIAIAMPYDPPNRVISLSEKKNIPYLVALDIQGDATKAFGNVRVTPTSFLIDTQGNIVESNVGEIDMNALREKVKQLQLPISELS